MRKRSSENHFAKAIANALATTNDRAEAVDLLRRYGTSIGCPILGAIHDLTQREPALIADMQQIVGKMGWPETMPNWVRHLISTVRCRSERFPFPSPLQDKSYVPRTPIQRRIYRDIRDHGVKSAIYVPVHGSGGRTTALTLSSSAQIDIPAVISLHWQSLMIVGYTFVEHLERKTSCARMSDDYRTLTDRHLDCLVWVARGKTKYETAKILGISEQTAKEHLQEAAKRLNAVNTTHAVAIAIKNALIAL